MTLPSRFVEEFWEDLLDASTWYEIRRPELGEQFERAVLDVTRLVTRYPEAFPKVRGDYRSALVRRFRHKVIYKVHSEFVEFKGVVHSMRDLPRWLESRLEEE